MGKIPKLATAVLTVALCLGAAGVSAADEPPLPRPDRKDRPGVTDCGLLSPQQAYVGFYGPRGKFVPGGSALNADGTAAVRGGVIEGTVALETFNGGCGLSATIYMESKFCREYGPYTRCGWREWGVAEYTYGDIPTNGVRVFEPIVSAARAGRHTYRMVVEVSGNRLEAEEGRTGARFRGALLPGRTTARFEGPEVRLSS